MIGYTIGVDGYEDIAARSAEAMARHTGLKCRVMGRPEVPAGEACHVSWHKLIGFQWFNTEDWLLWFDADLFCLHDWDPRGIAAAHPGHFCVVPEWTSGIMDEAKIIKLHRPYFNAGLWIAPRSAAPAMRDAYDRRTVWHRWMEQSAINSALQDHNIPLHELAQTYNVDTGRRSGLTMENMAGSAAVNVHVTAASLEDRLRWQRRLFDAAC